MEFEFDKEMDALLRQATRSGEIQPNTESDLHIDADEISIFAENALPEKAKMRVTKHLADCDTCRILLSNVITLNSEADSESASATIGVTETNVIASTTVPWFKRLFATQNLAYGLGALVILFVGMIGFLVVPNLLNSSGSDVAQLSKNKTQQSLEDTASAANTTFGDKESSPANSNLNEDTDNINSSETSPESTTEEQPKETVSPSGRKVNETEDETRGDVRDLKAKDADVAPLRDEPITAQDKSGKSSNKVAREDYSPKKIEEDRKKINDGILKSEAKPLPPPKATPSAAAKKTKSKVKKPAVLGRTGNRRQRNKKNNEINLSSGASADEKNSPRKTTLTRKIGGKTFTKKNRVWYVSAYRGQKTTNLRRATNDYRKLGSGLHSIVNRLKGTVVIVWKNKAYRIQ